MKKLVSMLLAVMMLALPVMAMAESPMELAAAAVNAGRAVFTESAVEVDLSAFVTENPEGGANPIAAIGSLISGLTEKGYVQADQMGTSVALNGTDLVNFNAAVKDGSLYVSSNLIGEKAVAINMPEFIQLLGTLGIELPESVLKLLQGDTSGIQLPSFENTIAAISALAQSKMDLQMVEVTEQPADCDPVNYMTTISLTAEDLTPLADAMLKDLEQVPAELLAMTGMDLTQLGEQVKAAISSFQGADVTLYLNVTEEGATDINAIAYMAKVQNGEDYELVMSGVYTVLTDENGKNYYVDFKPTVNGEGRGAIVCKAIVNDGRTDTGLTVYNAADNEEGMVKSVYLGVTSVTEENSTKLAASLEALQDNNEMAQVCYLEAEDSFANDTQTQKGSLTFFANNEENDQINVAWNSEKAEAQKTSHVAITSGEKLSCTIDCTTTTADIEGVAQENMNLTIKATGSVLDGQEVVLNDAATSVINKNGDDFTAVQIHVVDGNVMGFAIPTITCSANVYSGDPVASIAAEDAVRPGTMDAEGLQTWLSEVASNASMQLITVMQQLPEDVLMLFMGGSGAEAEYAEDVPAVNE